MIYEIFKYERMNEERMKIRKRKSTLELMWIELAISATPAIQPITAYQHLSRSNMNAWPDTPSVP
jgi:hypothetical protein